jgi:hypothetical protein
LQSRSWPRNAPNAADYLIINDNRGNRDNVLVFWLASPLIPASSGKQAARDLLDKYIVLGVVHAHTNKDATFTFDRAGTPEVTSAKNERLQLLSTWMPCRQLLLARLQRSKQRSAIPWESLERAFNGMCLPMAR